MKIIHLTTSTSGGAGIATVRLHHALLECGVNSSILCLKSTWPFPRNVIQYTESNPLVKRLWYRLKRLIFKNSVQVYGSKAAMLSSQMEIFTLPYSNFKPEKHPSIISADIIHLHWVAGFIDYLSFFRSINKPVVWTFHDMNPFLGGVHYTGDLLNQTPELAKLEKKFQSEKRHS
ncbi:MAG: glycosyltransferase, partial [Cyclobacteriaceae bacterium]|nr:glycosyltransferase [Cyclobacteriaceae bacterium]